MPKDETKSVLTMIEELVTQNTFSLDAVTAIQALKTRAAELERDVNTYRNMYQDATNTIRKLEADAESNKVRYSAIDQRERVANELEKKVAVCEARSSVYQEVITKLFANRIVRESATVPGVCGPSGTYPPIISTSGTREEG